MISLLANGPVATPAITWSMIVLGAATTLLLIRRRPRHREMTLRGPWLWAVVAVGCVSLVESWLSASPFWAADPVGRSLRYLAAVSLACPGIAVMGAKRPQSRGWGFIVASLWIILALPAGEALISAGGQQVAVDGVRSWFLLLVIVIGWITYWGTTNLPAASFAFTGQLSMLLNYLPGDWPDARPSHGLLAIGCFLLAALLLRDRPSQTDSQGKQSDRIWQDFRNLHGLFWSLRVAERFNHESQRNRWNVQLRWQGFVFTDHDEEDSEKKSSPSKEISPSADRCFRSILRRFVGRDWIAARATEIREE